MTNQHTLQRAITAVFLITAGFLGTLRSPQTLPNNRNRIGLIMPN